MVSLSIRCIAALALCFTLLLPPIAFSDDSQPPTFDVNFVVLVAGSDTLERVTLSQLREEVDILNTYFVGANGERPVRFRFKAAYYARELAETACKELVSLGARPEDYDGDRWQRLFDSCADPRIADPRAINFFVYDSYSKRDGFADQTSHGRNNRDRPYVLIDWARLGHKIQSPEEHEMGHAFGLEHVCVEGATRSTSTNIMASGDCGRGSGGKRDLGFDPQQLRVITKNAREIRARMAGK